MCQVSLNIATSRYLMAGHKYLAGGQEGTSLIKW